MLGEVIAWFSVSVGTAGGIGKKLTVDVDWQWVSTLKGTLVLRGDPNSRQLVQTYKKDVWRLSGLCEKRKM